MHSFRWPAGASTPDLPIASASKAGSSPVSTIKWSCLPATRPWGCIEGGGVPAPMKLTEGVGNVSRKGGWCELPVSPIPDLLEGAAHPHRWALDSVKMPAASAWNWPSSPTCVRLDLLLPLPASRGSPWPPESQTGLPKAAPRDQLGLE